MGRICQAAFAAVLVAMMVAGSTPGVTMGQDDKAPSRRGNLLARVAAILNIRQGKLQDAFNQAWGELQQEVGKADVFQQLADLGKITQKQADEYKAWVKSRLNVSKAGLREPKGTLNQGKVTGQADEFKAWLKAKPDIPGVKADVHELVKERHHALMARIAKILDVGQQKLDGAFKQAQGELRDENVSNGLQELVSGGKLTQQLADELKTWLKSRPVDVLAVGPRQIKKLREEGVITQDQADRYRDWVKAQPKIAPATKTTEAEASRSK